MQLVGQLLMQFNSNAIKVIEKYTGSDATTHKWSFSVGDRGAKIFTVLESISNKINSESPDPM